MKVGGMPHQVAYLAQILPAAVQRDSIATALAKRMPSAYRRKPGTSSNSLAAKAARHPRVSLG
jgi:hypothetical protein